MEISHTPQGPKWWIGFEQVAENRAVRRTAVDQWSRQHYCVSNTIGGPTAQWVLTAQWEFISTWGSISHRCGHSDRNSDVAIVGSSWIEQMMELRLPTKRRCLHICIRCCETIVIPSRLKITKHFCELTHFRCWRPVRRKNVSASADPSTTFAAGVPSGENVSAAGVPSSGGTSCWVLLAQCCLWTLLIAVDAHQKQPWWPGQYSGGERLGDLFLTIVSLSGRLPVPPFFV